MKLLTLGIINVTLLLLSLNRNFSRLVDCSLRSVRQQAIIDILN